MKECFPILALFSLLTVAISCSSSNNEPQLSDISDAFYLSQARSQAYESEKAEEIAQSELEDIRSINRKLELFVLRLEEIVLESEKLVEKCQGHDTSRKSP